MATKKQPSEAHPKDGLPIATFEDESAWSAFLEREHASSKGLWVKLAKKGAGARSITYAEALEHALIWGWIDGQKGALDDAWWLQRFGPRRRRSIWSKINREKASALIEAGRMQAAGLAEVERAKADGRWDSAYDPPSRAQVTPELAAALEAAPAAKAFFAMLDSANRYAVLHRVSTAKKPETRDARIAKLVAMLARGEKLH